MPRALSIYLPGWPIRLAQRRDRSDARRWGDPGSGRPDAAAWLLWTSQPRRAGVQEVVHGCERAAAAGVRAGMTLAHARSLLAGMAVRDQATTPEEDAAALRRLARWMLRFAPVVAPDDPDGLMLDIAGCEKLFGGEREHARRIAAALARWGLRPRLAVAPTFACARAMARYGREEIIWIAEGAVREALGPLPVRALRIDERSVEALADVGIERIEHLFVLPREELAARFGRELLERLDRATGAVVETIQPIQLARRFEAAHAFDGPVRRPEIIEATTRELLTRLLKQLQTADRGVLELIVLLRCVDMGPETLSLRLTYPNRDSAHLWKLLSPRLERVHLGFGVEEITLRASRTGRMARQQAAFLRETAQEAADQPTALGELVDRLIDRLGGAAVTQVQPAETYVPEAAFVHTAVREIAPRTSGRARVAERAIYPADRPSQLFDSPEPLRILSLVPDGPPVWLEWRGQSGKVVSGVGPERITLPWWDHRLLAGATLRDYYEVEDEHGRRLWVYRDGGSGEWFVHGQWM
ncbi:MAG TPA: DNA polymerase Y family protein [Phycisphaerae bacterium]|nr:DNA polymerase Y family protein [Phycisphaerae bacterium]